MDLNFSPADEAFRLAVRFFLIDKLPPRTADVVRRGGHPGKAELQEWHAILHAKGWLAGGWPQEHGGAAWTAVQKLIFETECALAYAPRIVPFGVSMLGPVLIKYGSEEQKRHWLPRILDGSDWWCQGYSEPGAGSDLAAVKTTAVRDHDGAGEFYVVNGQKTWTTLGQHANMIFCLVRTDPGAKKQAGISFLLIDMASPGVEVRPIVTLDGEHEVNEVFFTDVRVPVANLVGQENKGWDCAKYLLTHERTNIAGAGTAAAAFERLRLVAATQRRKGRPLLDDPHFAARMARLEIDLENMKLTNLRVMAAQEGGSAPGVESSMLKIRGSQLRQEISSLVRRAMGPYAQPIVAPASEGDEGVVTFGPPEGACAAAQYFNNRKLSIYGGSNEIQRNIVAKTMLGL